MITLRKAEERGHLNFGWLDARHSFSFGSYFDPKWSAFSSLRVINEDLVDPGQGFDTHPHKDMEIITFILKGELEHRDTLGNHAVIRPGEIQVMSAGSGVLHSEFNPSKTEKTHLLQIWVTPDTLGLNPRYDQFKYAKKDNGLTLLAAKAPKEDGVIKIYQDVDISLASFSKESNFISELDEKRQYWIQVFKGSGLVNGIEIKSGDGVAISKEKVLKIKSKKELDFLFFNLA